MRKKETIYIWVLLLVILGVVLSLFSIDKQMNSEYKQQRIEEIAGARLPEQEQIVGVKISEPKNRIPYKTVSIVGDIIKIDGGKITIKAGEVEKTITADGNTQILKDLKENGVNSNVSVDIRELKTSAKVFASYYDDAGTKYRALTIQIMDF